MRRNKVRFKQNKESMMSSKKNGKRYLKIKVIIVSFRIADGAFQS
jgi:hypothetical protein